MNKVLSFISLLLIIVFCFCGCGKFKLDDYKAGEAIGGNIDGSLIKLNSEFIMFDDGGFLNDDIVRINSDEVDDYEDASDYYNDGTLYYKGIIDEVFCSENYLIVTQHNSEKCILIDCSKDTKSASITEVESIEKVDIDYSDFTKIECSYYVP